MNAQCAGKKKTPNYAETYRVTSVWKVKRKSAGEEGGFFVRERNVDAEIRRCHGCVAKKGAMDA